VRGRGAVSVGGFTIGGTGGAPTSLHWASEKKTRGPKEGGVRRKGGERAVSGSGLGRGGRGSAPMSLHWASEVSRRAQTRGPPLFTSDAQCSDVGALPLPRGGRGRGRELL